MRSRKSVLRGFTLVELMIVVAIVGVLAAIGVEGLRRYMFAAKASEAKQSIGEISRGAHSAFEREQMGSQAVAEGLDSVLASHNLCGDAIPIPLGTPPKGGKYQPNTANGADFHTGDDQNGWTCLRFELSQPIYHQYHYHRNASPVAPNSPSACVGNCYEAGALGDLNGDGVFGRYARTGVINTVTSELKSSSQVYIDDEAE